MQIPSINQEIRQRRWVLSFGLWFYWMIVLEIIWAEGSRNINTLHILWRYDDIIRISMQYRAVVLIVWYLVRLCKSILLNYNTNQPYTRSNMICIFLCIYIANTLLTTTCYCNISFLTTTINNNDIDIRKLPRQRLNYHQFQHKQNKR